MRAARRDALVVALAAAATYALSLGNGFVYDDIPQILENPWLRSVRHVPDILASHVWGFSALHEPVYYRPAMHLLNLAVFQLAGPRPWAFHVVSVALHAAVAVVACRLTLQLLGGERAAGARRGALIGGLLFAVHPANAEAVAWVGALPDQLCALFALLCIGSHAGLMPSGRRMPWASLGWLLAALFSKETALVVPALLLAVDLSRPDRGDLRDVVRRLALPVLAVAAFLALRTAVVGGILPAGTGLSAGLGSPPLPRMIAALVHYAGKLVFPWPLSFVHELPDLVGVRDLLGSPGAWVLAAWTAGGAWAVRRAREQTVALSFALFLVPLAPPLFAAVAMYPPLADRYLYLPLFGFAVLCGRLGASAPVGRAAASPVGPLLFGAAVLCAGVATALRTADFGSNLTLWSDTVAKVPASGLARGRLATALFADGRYEAGAREAREAIRLNPQDPAHHYNLALASERAGVLDVAAGEYRRAIALGNDDAEAHVHLASVLLRMGDARGAAVHASGAVGRDSSNAEAHYVLGRALVNLGDYAAGAEELAHAARLRPEATSWRRDAELAAQMAARTAVP